MPRGNYRPYKPPFDPSITQELESALRDAGRDDLVDALRKAGIRELEEELHGTKERVKALEIEKVGWLTKDQMFQAFDERAQQKVVSTGKKVANAVVKTLLVAAVSGIAGLIGILIIFAWKGMHAP